MDITSAGLKKRAGKLRSNPGIDMTPLVDLGFLLISFFIFTTTMRDKTTLKLFMPHDGEPTSVAETKVLTVLLGDHNRVLAYEGALQDALKSDKFVPSSYDESEGVGKLIREKQKQLLSANKKDELVLLIKPTVRSTYKNVIDALDEATINGVTRYLLVDASAGESQLFR